MSDLSVLEIGIGDEVRVHYHPPGLTMSFVEGVVIRVNVTTLRGRMFVVDATYEVILDREQPVKAGYQSYVLYERLDDFPGRIEVLSTRQKTERKPAPEPSSDEIGQESAQEIEQKPASERQVELKPARETVTDPGPLQVEVERQEVRRPGGLIASIFGQRR